MNIDISFPKPPIIEALIDIRVIFSKEVDLETLAEFQKNIKDKFPERKERVNWESKFQVKPGSAPEFAIPTGGINGYLFFSVDKKKIVQARKDGFTFNKLQPYSKWLDFSKEAKELWNNFVKLTHPEKVSRIAVRYINKIELPLPFKDFKDYILTTPEVALGIPQGLSSFFMRLVIPNPDLQATAIVTETFENIDQKKNVLPLVLDIDVSKDVKLDSNSEEIWRILDEDLRKYKNTIFLSSITDKTKELFQ